jgi:tellurite methyltransferase
MPSDVVPSSAMPARSLEDEFGAIDIYLFDQILRGRIRSADRILDAGCGFGRNLVYFLRNGYDVFGVDPDADAIQEVRRLAGELAPERSLEHFHREQIEHSSFPDGFATVVISSAVLHFADDDRTFDAMLDGTWRLLASGGLFFCRLASTIGIETRVKRIGDEGRRYLLPDGTSRYLVDETFLMMRTRALGGRLLDPIKTTVVQDQRSMTTWVVRKD